MSRLLVFLKSTTGFLTAVAALIGAVVALVGIFGNFKSNASSVSSQSSFSAAASAQSSASSSGASQSSLSTAASAQSGAPSTAGQPNSGQPPPKVDAVFSQGTMRVPWSWLIDLDLGVYASDQSTADFWWDSADVKRRLVPKGATFFLVGSQDFDALGLDRIKSLPFSGNEIRADFDPSNSATNLVPTGTVLAYKTKQGRYGKLLIVSYGRDLQVRWLTYSGS